MDDSIHRCTPQEAHPFLASKWLHTQFLIDPEEMQHLLQALGTIYLFSTMGVQPVGGNRISPERFLKHYGVYIELLKKGVPPVDQEFRFYFTSVITSSLDALQAVQVGADREIIRPLLPVLQMQLHRFDYSKFSDNC